MMMKKRHFRYVKFGARRETIIRELFFMEIAHQKAAVAIPAQPFAAL
jgi:hypothetical protein